ncbi:MAG: FTR1 family protein [Candidatus Kerfeldbacteria bacterium]|nr:FTR1 family protein [Candidatus Kerfeldbacteria bacterium]
MAASFLITIRESLEAALIVGIVISYLRRTSQTTYIRVAWLGVIAGVAFSVFCAILFQRLLGGFVGRTEAIFEGFAMLAGGLLITTLIFWMMQRYQSSAKLKKQIDQHVTAAYPWGIFWLTGVAVMREGIETVIFLQSARFTSPDHNLIGALLGIAAGIALGYAVYTGTLKMNLKRFFTVTAILLMFIAAGLIAHGVHELQEAHLLPWGTDELWNINPTQLADGTLPFWHENGTVGSFLKSLFGFNGNPSLLEVLAYGIYLSGIAVLWYLMRGSTQTKKPVDAAESA